MGRKELSGFSLNNKTVETLSGRPDPCFAESGPNWLTERQTSNSVYQMDFQPYRHKNVDANESGPAKVMSDGFILNNKVQQDFVPRKTDKVFVKAEEMPYGKLDKLKKTDRPEYWNAYNASRYPSLSHDEFKYQSFEERMKVPDASDSELKKREPTGTIRNNLPVFEGVSCAADHFVTHNMTTLRANQLRRINWKTAPDLQNPYAVLRFRLAESKYPREECAGEHIFHCQFRHQIDTSIDRVPIRGPGFNQFSAGLVSGVGDYIDDYEVELMDHFVDGMFGILKRNLHRHFYDHLNSIFPDRLFKVEEDEE
ncbi:unnamed protein product [Schistocephalus solidus]|uniref:Uncharacterized protein n=1 Tax=Schistocephalus solidus TaxID=70667 RepID=A0A183SIP9_SCHSO|nr:unnamed protein product [Schistocephalus solidus]